MPAVFNVDDKRNVAPIANDIENGLMKIWADKRRHARNPQNDVLVPANVVGCLGNLIEAEIQPLDLPEELGRLHRRHQASAHPLE